METKQNANQKIRLSQSLTGQLLLTTVLIVFIPLAILGVLSIVISQQIIIDRIQHELQLSLSGQTLYIENWMQERQQDLEALAGNASVRTMDPVKVQEIVDQYFAMWGEFETIFVAGLDGNTIAFSNGSTFNISDRPYFLDALQGNSSISDPLISRASGSMVIVIASPVEVDGQVVGVAGGTIPLENFSNLFSTFLMGETSETFLVDAQGNMITVSRFTDELIQQGIIQDSSLEVNISLLEPGKALAGESRVAEYTSYRRIPVLGAYSWMPGLNWGIITEIETSEALSRLYGLRRAIIAIVVLMSVVTILISFFIFNRLTGRIRKMVTIATRLSVGDTHQEVKVLTRDEIGQLAGAFQSMVSYQQGMAETADQIARGNLTMTIVPHSDQDVLSRSFGKMIELLRAALSQVQGNASELNAASRQMYQSAGQSGQAISQIATTIQQVAKSTGQQAESISRTAQAIEQMSRAIDGVARGAQEQANAVAKASTITSQINEAINKVAQNATSVTENAANAAEAARKGSAVVDQTIQGMQAIKAKVSLSASKIQEMGARSDQISTISETIEDIASQTNLLALNAAIEAARAGEHGKGFAVVADEVRKLAERASLSTGEINTLVKSIQVTVLEASRAMDEGTGEVEKGVSFANQAGSALNTILDSANKVYQRASGTAQATSQISQSVLQLVEAVDSVSAVVEENTAATEQMAANSSEVSLAIENIASVSEENSAAIEEVSASTAEMNTQSAEVAASAQILAEMAGELNNVAARFKL
jgi:methyl-accepting chemotaxis protein